MESNDKKPIFTRGLLWILVLIILIIIIFLLLRYCGGKSKTIKVETISLSPTELYLEVGESERIYVTIFPEDATNPKVICTSTNTNVVTVDENCTVTAVGPGDASIVVNSEDGNATATCEVGVTDKLPDDEPTDDDPNEGNNGNTEEKATAKITKSGTAGWTAWAKQAKGTITVTGPAGATVKISGTNVSYGKATNKIGSNGKFSRTFTVSKDPASITVKVLNSAGKEIASAKADFKSLKLDNEAPKCTYSISGNYVVATCTDNASGLASHSIDWTKDGKTYKKKLTETTNKQTHSLTVKDNAGNQYSGTVNVTAKFDRCPSGYFNGWDSKCWTYDGGAKWTKIGSGYLTSGSCSANINGTTKRECPNTYTLYNETEGSVFTTGLALNVCTASARGYTTASIMARCYPEYVDYSGACPSGQHFGTDGLCYRSTSPINKYTYTIVK